MIKSLSTGVSGLNANATAMGVIGDNIANVKTTAFKSNSVSFANLLSQTLEGSSAGDGVRIWDTYTAWGQGAPENTGNPTDLSINGSGFFMVRDTSGATFYTRAGQFSFDRDGVLINPDKLKVQGYTIDETTGVLGALEDITVETGISPPNPTQTFTTYLNLDAESAVGDNFFTTLSIYDSLGNDIPLTLSFTKAADNEWDWEATVPDSAAGPNTPPFDPVVVGNGTLEFDANGVLLPANGSDPIIPIALTNGAEINPPDGSITWHLYDYDAAAGETDGPSNDSVTQFASPSGATALSQDGYPAGSLESISVDEQGFVSGVYSNGEINPLYQLAMANFANYQGLTGRGSNLFAESISSGPPTVGTPGSGSLGLITPGTLEMSNVDLSSEFVNMITTQRAFQANSKVIQTSDEILSELMNLKR